MLPSLRTRFSGALHQLADRGLTWLEHRLAASPPLTAPPQSPLPPVTGPALARIRIEEAARALLDHGDTAADVFRALRLEMNRMEQGGLNRPASTATATVEPPPPPAVDPPTFRDVVSLLSRRSKSMLERTWRARARAA